MTLQHVDKSVICSQRAVAIVGNVCWRRAMGPDQPRAGAAGCIRRMPH